MLDAYAKNNEQSLPTFEFYNASAEVEESEDPQPSAQAEGSPTEPVHADSGPSGPAGDAEPQGPQIG